MLLAGGKVRIGLAQAPGPSAWAINRRGKTRSVTYNMDREDGVNERYGIDHRSFITSCFAVSGDPARFGFRDVPEFLAACWRGRSGC